MKEIELAVQRAVLKRIDVEALAEKLAPKVEKAIEIGFIGALQDLQSNDDFIQEMTEALPTDAIAKSISAMIRERLKRQ